MEIEQWILSHEITIRLGFFLGILALLAAAEHWLPRRTPSTPKARRWMNNLALATFNALLMRLAFPVAAVGLAAYGAAQGWGVLIHFDVPFWLAFPVAVVGMDFVIWLQHVVVHAVPALWRLHQVHHADPDFDATTAVRFHPAEMLLSMLVKFAVILLLGSPVVAVLAFEVLLNATAMFNHGNVRLPGRLDQVLRWWMVTPDMHRVHHSASGDETSSNFGFNLPWWDRIFGTYRDQPRAGHDGMTLGIRGLAGPQSVGIGAMLVLPFRKGVDRSAGFSGRVEP